MRIQINDRSTYAITSRNYTDEGFLRVPGKVARTGIQEYMAKELGLDGDPNRIVRVMRPAEEVFNSESLQSYEGIDITIEHPSEGMINCDSYKRLSKGTIVGIARQAGDFVEANLIIKDTEAIKAVESGKVQLSVGYSAFYDDNVPEGADYEFIQRDIITNHVALVDQARAGFQARLFDNKPKGTTMKKIVLDSGRSVEISDDATAMLISDSIERKDNALKEMNETIDSLKGKVDSLKDENKELKKLSSDSAIKKRLSVVGKVMDAAKRICGESFSCDSMDPQMIRIEAMKESKPSLDWADESPAYIKGRFDALDEHMEEKKKDMEDHEDYEDDDDEDDEEKMKMKNRKDKKNVDSQYKKLAGDGARKKSPLGSAAKKYGQSLGQSWKKTVGE